jgi:hypothetical protein
VNITVSNRAALVMSAAALVMSAGFAGGPALARAAGINADKVDGLHAVPAKASTAQRKGKLVATDPATGSFKPNVIPPGAKFPAKAPVGVTLTGMWAFDTQSAGTGGDYGSAIDFGTELPSEPTAVFSETGGSVAHCPGTYEHPAAAPGYICLYKNGGGGLDFTDLISFSNGNRGLGYRFSATTTGANQDIYANGTWAVTTAAASPLKAGSGSATK